MRPVFRLPVAFAAGLLLACCFAPIGWWWLTSIPVATLALLMRGQKLRWAIGIGLLFGYGFVGLLCHWMSVLGLDAWIGITLGYGSFWGLVGLLWYGTLRTRLWPLWSAAAYVTIETLWTIVPWGGFPWAKLAFVTPGHAPAALSALGGETFVSFVIAFSALLIAWAIDRIFAASRSRATRRDVTMALVPAVIAVFFAWLLPTTGVFINTPIVGEGSGPKTVVAAAVQGNVPRLGLDFNSQAYAVLKNHVAETVKLADQVAAGQAQQPDFVLWPENSSDIDPYTSSDAAALITIAVDAIKAPTLVGAYVDDPQDNTRFYNISMEWLPHGDNPPPIGSDRTYIKRQPVPFGEVLPYRSFLTKFIKRFDRVPRDMVSGTKPGVFQLGPAKVGSVICFEVAYDRLVRDVIRAGGRLITVQTNNATYGETGQPQQQLQISRLRAVEYDRAVLIAATSGVSAVIMPDGTITQETKEFTAASLVSTMPLRSNLTLAAHYGEWVTWTIALVGIVMAILGVGRRKSRSGPRHD
jgi:apolipoprotein N-acyltransferase